MMDIIFKILLLDGLHFTLDGFRLAYGFIAFWMWLLTGIFSFEYFNHEREHLKRYIAFTLLTFAATEGVMFSADLMTTFFFFEILSLTSFVWVIHEETGEAIRAAKTYFFIAVIGGLILFMGLALMKMEAGTLAYGELHEAILAVPNKGTIMAAGICILLGFGAKAGMFPLHIWLPKSHPVAPSPASALLSGILTKVGIFGILMTAVPGFMGNDALSVPFGLIILIAGTITMALGALLALFSVNLKRTLACSSMSQIGFILVGIGTMIIISAITADPSLVSGAHGTEAAQALSHEVLHLAKEAEGLAHNGVVLHMVNHSLIKLTLFMIAGVVVMNLHKLNLNEIRGYGRGKLFMLPFALGAMGISGIPFFSGYLSKTLLHEGLVVAREALELKAELLGWSFNGFLPGILTAVEWIFLVSGGFTFAYMLKLFICLFVEKNPECQEEYDRAKPSMGYVSTMVIILSGLAFPILGQPSIMGKLAHLMTGEEFFHHFHAFSAANLKGAFISLGIGAVVYLIVVRQILMKREVYVDLWPKGLDLEDMLYRPLLLKVLPGIGGAFASFFANNTITEPLAKILLKIGQKIAAFFSASLDGIIVLSRHTLFREKERRTEAKHHSNWDKIKKRGQIIVEPILDNFSFALMMTALGMVVVLLAILFSTLR